MDTYLIYPMRFSSSMKLCSRKLREMPPPNSALCVDHGSRYVTGREKGGKEGVMAGRREGGNYVDCGV